MSKVYTEEGSFYGLGDAIRNKNNSANTYSPPEMAAAVNAIPSILKISNGKSIQVPAVDTDIPAETFVEYVGDKVYGAIDVGNAVAAAAGSDQISVGLGESQLVSSGRYLYLRTMRDGAILRGPLSSGDYISGLNIKTINDTTAFGATDVYDDGTSTLRVFLISVQGGAISRSATANADWYSGSFWGTTPVITNNGTSADIYYKYSDKILKRGCTFSNNTITFDASPTELVSGLNTSTYSLVFREVGGDVLAVGNRLADSSTYQGTIISMNNPSSRVMVGSTVPASASYLTYKNAIAVNDGVLTHFDGKNSADSTKVGVLSWATVDSNGVTLRDETYIDYSSVLTQSTYVVQNQSIAMNKDGDIVLIAFIRQGSSTGSVIPRKLYCASVNINNDTITVGQFREVKNSGSTVIRYDNSPSVISIAPGDFAVSYSQASDASSVWAPLRKYTLPTSAKIATGQIDGVTATSLTSSTPGTVIELSS